MRYYIDGYNFLFSLYDIDEPHDLQQHRDILLGELNDWVQRIPNLAITIVFDAGVAPHSHRYQSGSLEVAYSDERTDADDWIVEHIEVRHREACTVVTNDKRLARRCRALGAKTQSPASWLLKLKKKADKIISAESREPRPPRAKTATKQTSQVTFDVDSPSFLERQAGESELERWLRIFEQRLSE